jgi:hypothetical protein
MLPVVLIMNFLRAEAKKLLKTIQIIKNNSKYNRYVNIYMYNLFRKMCGTRWRRYLCFDTWVRFQIIFFTKKTRLAKSKGHGNEPVFCDFFMHKSVGHRSRTQPIEPFRFLLRIAEIFVIWNQLPAINDTIRFSITNISANSKSKSERRLENLCKGPMLTDLCKKSKKKVHWHDPLNPKRKCMKNQSLIKKSCSHPGHVRWIPTIKYN